MLGEYKVGTEMLIVVDIAASDLVLVSIVDDDKEEIVELIDVEVAKTEDNAGVVEVSDVVVSSDVVAFVKGHGGVGVLAVLEMLDVVIFVVGRCVWFTEAHTDDQPLDGSHDVVVITIELGSDALLVNDGIEELVKGPCPFKEGWLDEESGASDNAMNADTSLPKSRKSVQRSILACSKNMPLEGE
ncbi:hypothetical protein P280DRAFT_485490 [Massarina eburnea CBS 473.64]|uniref:Uncharacterized protein n=1 Tax=Massarina eburnea CBS 473.64 TaxID=1395130 RepID=A0A6A6RGD5_9PLEO|nr:hypothetical protein P280DRAFT_485490 [Massarina eburnea CBS 473.64]